MEKIRFTKMHGAGNDYIYVDVTRHPIDDPVAASRLWSDRHKGIGSDGLVLIGRSAVPEADFSMRIFNADGSEAMMCGNAARCIGKYLFEKGLTHQTVIEFAHVLDDGSLRTRVWERGSGITMACGTGACATAVAALTQRASRSSRIIMDGGTLDIEWREHDNHVYLTGPASFVFEGEIEC